MISHVGAPRGRIGLACIGPGGTLHMHSGCDAVLGNLEPLAGRAERVLLARSCPRGKAPSRDEAIGTSILALDEAAIRFVVYRCDEAIVRRGDYRPGRQRGSIAADLQELRIQSRT
jgi:hypothetical protein